MTAKLPVRLLFIAFVSAGAIGACSGDDAGSGPSDKAECVTANNLIEEGEECDGTNFNNQTCATYTMNAMPGGVLKCTTSCTIDRSGCVSGGGGAGGGGPGTGGSR